MAALGQITFAFLQVLKLIFEKLKSAIDGLNFGSDIGLPLLWVSQNSKLAGNLGEGRLLSHFIHLEKINKLEVIIQFSLSELKLDLI